MMGSVTDFRFLTDSHGTRRNNVFIPRIRAFSRVDPFSSTVLKLPLQTDRQTDGRAVSRKCL